MPVLKVKQSTAYLCSQMQPSIPPCKAVGMEDELSAAVPQDVPKAAVK